jgi:hypothetical protein
LSTRNPTRPDPGSNSGRRCGKPATNRLSYGAVEYWLLSDVISTAKMKIMWVVAEDFANWWSRLIHLYKNRHKIHVIQ